MPVTGIQKAMVKSMTAAAAVPTFGYADEVEMGAVMDVRAQMKDLALQQGVKLTVLPFILKVHNPPARPPGGRCAAILPRECSARAPRPVAAAPCCVLTSMRAALRAFPSHCWTTPS